MGDAIHAARREPMTPEGALDLGATAEELLTQAAELAAGRAARTLTPGAGSPLKQTLVALTEGTRLADHRAPGPASLQVIVGSVTMGYEGTAVDLQAGQWAAIPDRTHDLSAVTDAVVLLTVAPNPA